MSKKKRFLSVCIDLEEFDAPFDYGYSISKEDQYKISLEGLRHLIDFLKKYELKLTFFTTTNMARASV